MGLLYGCAGRLNTKNGGFRPGQAVCQTCPGGGQGTGPVTPDGKTYWAFHGIPGNISGDNNEIVWAEQGKVVTSFKRLSLSPTIAGEWKDVGPTSVGALWTITRDPSSTNFTCVCNGPACGQTEHQLFRGPVSADGRTCTAFSIPGAISSDNNEITWRSGGRVVNHFVRWFPAKQPSATVAGSYRAFVYGSADTRASAAVAGTVWQIEGSNDNFTVRAGKQSVITGCSIQTGRALSCPAWASQNVVGARDANSGGLPGPLGLAIA
jgi:hypothetical protein